MTLFQKIHYSVKLSVFLLFPVVTKPPYEITETGWGEFEIIIKIFFIDPNERPVRANTNSYLAVSEKAERYGGAVVITVALQQGPGFESTIQVDQNERVLIYFDCLMIDILELEWHVDTVVSSLASKQSLSFLVSWAIFVWSMFSLYLRSFSQCHPPTVTHVRVTSSKLVAFQSVLALL